MNSALESGIFDFSGYVEARRGTRNMKTACLLKGRVTETGGLRLRKKVPLSPGPVEVIIQKSPSVSESPARKNSRQNKRKLRRYIEEIRAIKAPPPPNDGLSVDGVLYGPKNGRGDVR